MSSIKRSPLPVGPGPLETPSSSNLPTPAPTTTTATASIDPYALTEQRGSRGSTFLSGAQTTSSSQARVDYAESTAATQDLSWSATEAAELQRSFSLIEQTLHAINRLFVITDLDSNERAYFRQCIAALKQERAAIKKKLDEVNGRIQAGENRVAELAAEPAQKKGPAHAFSAEVWDPEKNGIAAKARRDFSSEVWDPEKNGIAAKARHDFSSEVWDPEKNGIAAKARHDFSSEVWDPEKNGIAAKARHDFSSEVWDPEKNGIAAKARHDFSSEVWDPKKNGIAAKARHDFSSEVWNPEKNGIAAKARHDFSSEVWNPEKNGIAAKARHDFSSEVWNPEKNGIAAQARHDFSSEVWDPEKNGIAAKARHDFSSEVWDPEKNGIAAKARRDFSSEVWDPYQNGFVAAFVTFTPTDAGLRLSVELANLEKLRAVRDELTRALQDLDEAIRVLEAEDAKQNQVDPTNVVDRLRRSSKTLASPPLYRQTLLQAINHTYPSEFDINFWGV